MPIMPVAYASKIVRKRVKQLSDIVYQIDDSSKQTDVGICFAINGVLIPMYSNDRLSEAIANAEKLGVDGVISEFNSTVDYALQTMRTAYSYPFGLYALCKILRREQEYLDAKEIVDRHNKAINEQREAGIAKYKQAREQERLERISQLSEKVKRGENVTKIEFLDLVDHYNIAVAPGTKGFIKKKLIEISQKEASLSKTGKSQEIFQVYKDLQNTINGFKLAVEVE